MIKTKTEELCDELATYFFGSKDAIIPEVVAAIFKELIALHKDEKPKDITRN